MKNKDLLTKSETLQVLKESMLGHLGVYNSCSTFKPEMVERVVFVCKGNICRSALAEWYMKPKMPAVTSFGLGCPDGDPANSRMLQVARENGLELRQHKTTSIGSFELKKGDLLVAMEPGHISSLKKALKRSANYQYLLLGMLGAPQQATISDPYGKEKRFFDETAAIIFRAVDSLCERLG